MKNKNIEFGVFLLSLGIVFMLINTGVIKWSVINALFDLWPAVFIIIGINIIFKNNWIVRIIMWLLFLAAILSYGYFFSYRWEGPGTDWKNTVSVEKVAETERGELKLALGGTRLDINSTSSNLYEAYIKNPDVKHDVSYKNGKKTAEVKFQRNNYVGINPDRVAEDFKVSVNDNIIWNIVLDVGAVSGVIDMSKLKVGELDVDMGAGNIKFIFGEKQKKVFVKIDSGASSIDIVVPTNSGVKIKMDGALNNTNLGSLGWKRQGGYYTSPNYENAVNKIEMDVDMGVGRFNVDVR